MIMFLGYSPRILEPGLLCGKQAKTERSAWGLRPVILAAQEAEAGGLPVPGRPGLQSELKAILGNFCIKV